MKNPNTPANRMKRSLAERWSSEDYPGAEPRFQIMLLVKDIIVFVLLPAFAVILFKSCENSSMSSSKKSPAQNLKRDAARAGDSSKSQIIDFRPSVKVGGGEVGYSGISKRSLGTLVRVKLLNVVETYSTAPVHAQIVDAGLGRSLIGGTLIGDAIPDPGYERININFKFARDSNRDNVALPVSARALSLDGTLGLNATKKEGFFARSVYNSANSSAQEAQGRMNAAVDFASVLFKALTAGLVQEFGAGSQVERNRSQVLTLQPAIEFLAELTDFFPKGSK